MSASLDIKPPPNFPVTEVTPQTIAHFRAGLSPKLSRQLDDRWCARFILARPASIKKAIDMCIAWDTWRHSLLKPIEPSNVQYTPNTILLCPDQAYDHPWIHLTICAHNGFDKEGEYCMFVYWD
jgi:hypothetical protein